MRKLYVLLSSLSIVFAVNAQISVAVTGATNTTPNLQASYTSLASALTDLNAVTAMSGPVVLTCTGGGSETAPSTGLTIGSATLNPVLSATNTITLNTSGGTATLNAGVGTATPSGATPDGILKLVGADHVTIDGFTFTDGNASNPATMEFGVALFKRAAGDGCNNNTIQNCTFNMQRINNASGTAPMIDGAVGILVINAVPTAATTGLTPTNGGTLGTNGTNSGNKFYTNSINGGNIGIGLSGYAASAGVGPNPAATTFLGDLGNDIGGTASGTGNSVLNFGGGGTTAAAGIRANNQWGINISYNTINNNDGSGVNHTGTLRGIYAQAGTSANATINNNSVTIHGGATTSQTAFIENAIGSTAASNTITINDNTLTGDYLTATSGVFYGIYNTSTPATLNIQNNSVSGWSYSDAALTGSGVNYPVYVSSAGTNVNVLSNTVNNISRTGTTGATTIGIYVSSGTNQTVNLNTVSNLSIDGAGTASVMYGIQTTGTTVVCNNNNVNNLQVIKTTGTSAMYGIYNISSPTNENYNNNDVHTLIHNGTGTVYGIYANTTTGIRTTAGNLVYNLITGGTTIAGITMTTSSPTVYKNKIYDLQSNSTGAPTVSGILITSLGTAGAANIYNNLIGDLRAPTANISGSAPALRGINITATTANSTFAVSSNTVYLNGSSSGTNFGSAALYVTASATATTASLTLKNNILVNNSTAAGTGFTSAYQRSTADLANFNTSSNNNLLYAGTPSATNVIFYDGTSSQTLADYKTKVSPRDNAAVTENPPFLTTIGSSGSFLHIDPSVATQVESGGVAVAGITDDYDGDARNATTPDIGADEGTFTLADVSGPSITYSLVANTSCLTAPTFSTGIVDASGVNTTAGTKPRLYFKRSTDANAFNDNTSGTDGWKYIEASNSSSPFSFTFDYSLLSGGTGVAAGQSIQYFVVAQDVLGNVSINSGTFNAAPSSVDLTASAFPITGTVNSFNLLPGLTGTVTVGPSGTYPTLTGTGGLFEAINTNGLAGNTIAELENGSITETGSIALNAIIYGCVANSTLTIKPAGGAVTILTGAVATGSVIKLNGADYVIIDGSNNGTASRDLTIRNTTTTTSGNAVIWLAAPSSGNGSTNNTIKNSIIEGNSATTSFIGIYVGGNTTVSVTAAGNERNNNNTITNNLLRKTQHGLAMFGYAAASPDLNNVVSNNNFGTATAGEGFSLSGMNLDRQENAVVSGNEVQNVSIGGTAAVSYFGIRLLDFKNGQAFGNRVHSLSYTGTSTGKIYGIAVTNSTYTTAGNPSQSLLYNNSISNITSTATSTGVWNTTGLYAGSGYGDKYYFNSVHLPGQLANSNAGLASAFAAGDPNLSGTPTNADIRNNIFSITGSSATAGGNFWAFYTTLSSLSGFTVNYNNLYANTTNGTGHVGRLGTTNYTTLGAWQAAAGQDANSVSTAPTFVSNTDLHLVPGLNAGLDNSGTPIAGISTDIDGDTRNASTPDIGVDEFAAPSCTGAIGGTASAAPSGPFCASGSTIISATGFSVGLGSTYLWQSSADAAFTTPVDIGTASNSYSTLSTGSITTTTYYRLKVTCTSGTAVDYSTVVTVTVNPLPTAPVTPGTPAPVCAPATVLLDASGSNAASPAFQWKLNGTNISGATNATHAASASGSYTVMVTDGVTTCSNTSSAVVVTVNPQPGSPTANATPSTVCVGDAINLSSSVAPLPPYTMNAAGSESFIDIDGSGTSIGTMGDDNEFNITIPAFTFNGVAYTAARVGMNGGIALGSTTGDISTANAALPSTANSAGNILLLPWWDDLDVQSTPATTIKTATVGSKFIVQWTNTIHNNTSGNTIKFQVQLDLATGAIHFVYDDVDLGNATYNAGASGTVGIQVSSTSALQYSFNTASLSAGQCISFIPASPGYLWAGPNGFTSNLQNPVITNATAAAAGTYTVTFTNTVTGCQNTANVAVTVNPIVLAGTVGGPQLCDNQDVSNNNFTDNSCGYIAKVVPSGASPVAGNVNTCVKIDATVQNYNGQPYLQRHYDIEPANSPATATATVTLYALQSEFDMYNSNNGAYPDLPTGPSDATGIAHLRVTQFHGAGTAPGNYTGGAELLDPVDANIVWNAINNWWEITFNVSSFSGFYIHTTTGNSPLPANLLTFSGQRLGSANQLKWTVAQEIDVQDYQVQRSEDGRNWIKVGTVASLGNTNSQRSYGFTDYNVSGVKQLYRLQIVDRNAAERLSNVIVITGAKAALLTVSGLFPNPAATQINLLLDAPAKDNVTIKVMDAVGRLVKIQKSGVEAGSNTIPVNVTGLAQGSYLVQVSSENNTESAVSRFIKE